jgi:hypothetical protein
MPALDGPAFLVRGICSEVPDYRFPPTLALWPPPESAKSPRSVLPYPYNRPLFRTIVTYNIILNFYFIKDYYKNFVDFKIKYAASWDMTLPAAKIHTLRTSSNK